ncbi:MAG: AAA family ATPase [Planctomycetota bacterium]|nr:AAA family ATPase [Planctomycetota bacterium]MDP6941093.1 AAA family ATPase [Planctomycetota bacterium]
MLNESGLVYKYFDLIDGFIRVRILSDEEAVRIPRGGGDDPPDRREYRHLIVDACVVGLNETVLPRVQEIYPDDAAAAEDLLYQICVDVNPRLEIHTVALPAEAEAEVEAQKEQSLEELRDRAENLEAKILSEVVGQDDHVRAICRAVRKASVGLNDPTRPIGSFLMVGRTGTGKTELAKSLARNLWDDKSLVRLDCSEFALPHETAKLIGAPPGYVGHNEGGTLTEALIENPNAVVLFDEVEKGHEKLHNMLLQILDDGRLTDSKGNTVSFRNAVVLMTSNVGTADYAEASSRLGFGREGCLEEQDFVQLTQAAMRRYFKPELLNRLDGVQVFGALSRKAAARIAEMKLEEVSSRLCNAGVQLEWSAKLPSILASEGYSEEYGAREVRRTVSRLVEDPLTNEILDGQHSRGAHLSARWTKNGVRFVKKATSRRRRKSA